MSNLHGSSALWIVACLAHIPALLVVAQALQPPPPASAMRSFLMDCATLIVPMVLVLTVLAEQVYWTLLAVLLAAACCTKRSSHAPAQPASTDPVAPAHPMAISWFKGTVVALTCIAILAVDFTIFPRNLAKTESFGTSIMDAGTGAFIVSSALTSRTARGVSTTSGVPWQRALVLLLGIGRGLVLKVLDYPQHVSEYGVHWNFFATLFVVWTAADLLSLLPLQQAVGIIMLLGYQLALSLQDGALTAYLLSAQRDDWLSADKEGIFSLLGYLPLYLLAQELSRRCFFSNSSSSSGALIGWAAGLWVSWLLTAALLQDTSRRLCNLPYVLFVLAVCLSMLAVLRLCEEHSLLLPSHAHGQLLEHLSACSLQVFLAANLLTGLVNLSMQTLRTPPAAALAVLLTYSCAFSAIAWLLRAKRTTAAADAANK